MSLPLGFFDFLGLQWIIPLAILGVLLYGERLPEVAAKFGGQLMQLKKAAQAVRSEIESVATDTKYGITHASEKTDNTAHEEATAPKFEPPPAEAANETSSGEVPVEAH